MGSSASTSISTEQFSVVSARLKDGGFANADANLVVVADSLPSLHRSPSILPEYEKAIVDGKSAEEIKTLLIASYESATASATPAEDVVEETTDAASVAAAPEVVAPVDEPVAAEAEATVEAAVEPTPAPVDEVAVPVSVPEPEPEPAAAAVVAEDSPPAATATEAPPADP